MFRSMLKKWTALMLAACLLTGILPADTLAGWLTQARAAQAAQTGIYGESFDWVLASGGEERTSGEWRYRLILPENYAVITGHLDPSVTKLDVPAVLDGADVVALDKGALADHKALYTLRLPGNVNAIASGAIPRGVTLQGYNATYAQRYAESSRYPFESLSEFDFVTGMIDYADIAAENFIRVSASEVHMRRLEAARLAIGSRFFLVDPANAYQISYYRVTGIAEGENGFVILTCETPLVDEVMNTFSGVGEKMVLDVDSLMLERGATLANEAEVRASRGFQTPELDGEFTLPLKKDLKLKVKGTVSSEVEADFEGKLFAKKSLTITETRTSDISVGLETGLNLLENDVQDGGDELNMYSAVKYLAKRSEEMLDDSKKSAAFKLGTGMFFSYAGIVSLQIQFKFVVEFKGTASFHSHTVTVNTYYGDSEGHFEKNSRDLEKTESFEGAFEAKIGGAVEITGYLFCVGIIQVEAFAGFEIKVTISIPFREYSAAGTYLSPNMADCFTLSIHFIIEVGIRAGLIKILGMSGDIPSLSVGATVRILDIPIVESHFHYKPYCYVPSPTPGYVVYDRSLPKDNLHLAKDCPYSNAKVTFKIPAGIEATDIFYETDSFEIGFLVEEPETPYLNDSDFQFDGWYTTPDFQAGTKVVWPYMITGKETVFYAKLAKMHTMRMEYTTESNHPIVFERSYFPGEVFALHETIHAEPKWYASYYDKAFDYTVTLPLEDVVSFDANGNVIMPDHDLWLTEHNDPMVYAFFLESVDGGTALPVLHTLAAPGSQLKFPRASDPDLYEDKWLDEQSNTVSSPYTVPSNTTGTLRFFHILYSDFWSNSIQSGAEAFHYRDNGSYITITGYNPYRAQAPFYQEAYNLVIPSQINGKPVTTIGVEAFRGLSKMCSIHIPETVTRIDHRALQNCTNLRSLYLPDSLSSIGNQIIAGCTAIRELSIGKNCHGDGGYNNLYIGPGSALEKIILREGVTYISEYEFANYDEFYYRVHGFPNLKTVEFPSTLQTIGHGAFESSGLTSILIDSDLKKISDYAFYNNARLTSATIRGNGFSVHNNAFCSTPSLQSLTFSGLAKLDYQALNECGARALDLGEELVSIGNSGLKNCRNLKSLSIPDSVSSIGEYILDGCTAIEELSIGKNCHGDGGYKSLYIGQGSALRKLILREGVTYISNYEFANRDHYYGRIYGFPNLETVEFPTTLQTIGHGAFESSGLTSIFIDSDLKKISDYAFYNNARLTSATIRGNGFSVHNNAFCRTPSLQSLTFSGLAKLDHQALNECGARALDLGEDLVSIGNSGLKNCRNLKSLSIPDSVSSIGEYILEGCTAIEELSIGKNCHGDGGYKSLYIGQGSALRKLILREGVTYISNYEFANRGHYYGRIYGFPNLETVEFPSTLQTIGHGAFESSGLTSIYIDSDLKKISDYAFFNNARLTSATIRGNGFSVHNNAFCSTPSLQSLTFSGLAKLDYQALNECGARALDLGEDLVSIGNRGLANCRNLKSLYLPDSFSSMGEHIIAGCTAIEELSVGKDCHGTGGYNSLYIGQGSALRKLILREGVTYISNREFANRNHAYGYTYGFPNLETVVLPSTLQTIGEENLSRWPSVTTLHLGPNVTSIQDYSDLSRMTFITDEYSSYVAGFASGRGADYLVLNPEEYPSHTVSYVSALAGVSPDETVLEDGTVLVGSSEVRMLSPYTPPEVTAPEGYAFAGWYRDPEYGCAYQPGDVMGTKDLTLYARFVPQHSVVFALRIPAGHTMDGLSAGDAWDLPQGFMVYAVTAQAAGMPLELPQAPALNGYFFTGWYRDAEFTTPSTGGSATADGIVYYGGFEPASMGGGYQHSAEGLMISGYHLLESDGAALRLPDAVNGETVRGIAAYAFEDCEISSVTLPDGLTFVKLHAFTGCETLRSIEVSSASEHFTTRQGVLYSKDMTTLCRYPEGKLTPSFTIPSSVTAIAPYAFENCVNLRSVTFPDGLETIGEGAFENCTSLGTVSLPDTVTALEDRTFSGCTNLYSFSAYSLVSLGASALPVNLNLAVYGPVGEGVLHDWCKANAALQSSYNPYYLTVKLGSELLGLLLCEAGKPLPADLAYNVLEDGGVALALYRDSALTDEWDLANDLMPASDLTLYTVSTPLYTGEEITVTAEEADVTGILLTAYNGRGGDIVLPRELNGMPVIALDADFLSTVRGNVSSVDIGPEVIQISDTAMAMPEAYSFAGVIKAEEGSFAALWAESMGYVCQHSQHLLSFHTMGGASIASRTASAGTAVRLPVPVRTGASFLGWYRDEALTDPAVLDEDGLFLMPAEAVTLYAAWDQTEAFDCPYEYDETADGIIITGCTEDLAEAVIPQEINGVPVTAIADSAFAQSPVERIVLPETIRSIGDEAFRGASALTSVQLSEGLATIGSYAFADCSALTSVTLPDSVTVLGTSVFLNCTALQTAHIGSGLILPGERPFAGCTALESFTASDGGEYHVIDGVLFSSSGLVLECFPAGRSGVYYVPEGTRHIAPYAFEQSDVTKILFPAGLQTIGEGALRQCTALTSLTLDLAADPLDGTALIPDSLCVGCTALEDVTLGESITGIGAYAFMNCSRLAQITIGQSVASIGSMAFNGTDRGFLITGWPGSAAHAYAMANGHLFSAAEGTQAEQIRLPESFTLTMGAQQVLSPVILPEEAAETTPLTWFVSDEAIAAVTDGVLYALRRGETTVTVRARNGVEASAKLTVTGVPAESVSVAEVTEELARGNSLALSAEVLPAWAEDIPLSWTSSDETVASVDAQGVVTGLSAGTSLIRATAASGRYDEIPVTVFHAVEALELRDEVQAEDERRIMNLIGESMTHQLSVALLPADHSYSDLVYESSASHIASVDENGLITARGLGDADITVTTSHTCGDPITLTYRVSVVPYDLSGLALPETEPLVYSGASQQPAPVLELFGQILTPGTDYTILTDDAVHAGTHAYTLQGIGRFTGEISGTFEIIRAQAQLSYTGHSVYEADRFALSYESCGLTEVDARYTAADDPETVLEQLPNEPGNYLLTLTAAETDDVIGTELVIPIRIVESYVQSLTLSCSEVQLEAGQQVRPAVALLLEEGTPENAVTFAWSSTDSCVSVNADGTLSALAAGSASITFARTDREGEEVSLSVTVHEAGSLKTLTLPSALKTVESEAFLGNASVSRIVLPAGTEEVLSRAFADMSALCQVVVPEGVTLADDFLSGSDAVLLCTDGSQAESMGIPYVLTD